MFLRYLCIVTLCSMIVVGCQNMNNASTTTAPAPTTAQDGSFPSTDIGGTWALVGGTSSVPMFGSIAISTDGAVTGGSWTELGVTSGTFTGGTVSADSHGTISGTASVSAGDAHILSDGQMSLNKDLFIFAGSHNEAGIALRVINSYAITHPSKITFKGEPRTGRI